MGFMKHTCKACGVSMEETVLGEFTCLLCFPNINGKRTRKYLEKKPVYTKIDQWRTVAARTNEEKESIIESIHRKYILKPAALIPK